MTQRILVLGRHGQVATELQRLRAPSGFALEAHGRDTFDLAKTQEIGGFVKVFAPAAVINASAYSSVDLAETHSAEAFALNRDAPREIARACADLRVPLIHLSSDYVFDGAKSAPYVESDVKGPLNVYGASKSEGEDAVLASGANAVIIRTSWVFASHGANFVRTMLNLSETRDEVNVVADQVGRPTWARDLAQCSLDMVLRAFDGDPAARGVFHFAGTGDASWADLAEAVFAETGRATRVRRIASSEYPTPARRPMNSRLDTTKIVAALGIQPRPWREALGACLREL